MCVRQEHVFNIQEFLRCCNSRMFHSCFKRAPDGTMVHSSFKRASGLATAREENRGGNRYSSVASYVHLPSDQFTSESSEDS